jgi:hypothetical protein
LSQPKDLLNLRGFVIAEPPSEAIYDFKGYYQADRDFPQKAALSLENTMWQNTVLAS